MNNYLANSSPVVAFNIWDLNSAKAVMDGAAKEDQNVILQTSAGIYKKISCFPLREFITQYAARLGIQAWLHLDHCRDIDMIRDAIDRGWDSVMYDGSELPLSENVCITNQVAEWAHAKGVAVEAEIGRIGGVEEDISGCDKTVASHEDIDSFLNEANMDFIAVAFGNAHGAYKAPPTLHYDLVEYTVGRTSCPFVVHGASGFDDNTLRRLLSIPNVKKINISTDVKQAYRSGIMKAWQDGKMESESFQAITIEEHIYDAIVALVQAKLKVCRDCP